MTSVALECPPGVEIPEEALRALRSQFMAIDKDGSGHIDSGELKSMFLVLGDAVSDTDIARMVAEADEDGDGKISFGEFCVLLQSRRSASLSRGIARHAVLTEVAGAVGKHSYAVEEELAFSEHLNHCLRLDPYLTANGYLPISHETNSLFTVIGDGILLCKLINLAVADQIDERALNFPKKGKPLNPWETKENNNLAIGAAKSIGCSIVNIHATDISNCAVEHREYLILGMIWQIVKIQLLSTINLKAVPELVRLLNEGEELGDLLRLPPEQILLRWINFHMKGTGGERVVGNFGADLQDGEAYIRILSQIDPVRCPLSLLDQPADARCHSVVAAAKSMGIPALIQAADITAANKRLNLAFCAQIFNENHGMSMTEASAKIFESFAAADLVEEKAAGGTREERTFASWINSFDLGEGCHIHNLYHDIATTPALLKVIDKLRPIVDWKRVNVMKMNKFKHIENLNYAVALCRDTLRLNMPATGGVDLYEGNRTLVLGLVWQLMRMQVIEMLKDVGGGSNVTDADIVSWANAAVAASGRGSRLSSFRDESVANGAFLLDLLTAVEPRAVNPELVTPGSTPEEAALNAKYVLSVARKLGCLAFGTWEDITEVKPKMLMTLLAGIMQTAQKLGHTGK